MPPQPGAARRRAPRRPRVPVVPGQGDTGLAHGSAPVSARTEGGTRGDVPRRTGPALGIPVLAAVRIPRAVQARTGEEYRPVGPARSGPARHGSPSVGHR